MKGHLLGVQWLDGIALDSELRGRGFDSNSRHRVVSLSKTQQDAFTGTPQCTG